MSTAAAVSPDAHPAIRLVRPRVEQGAAIRALIEACRPLDVNSTYLYLLLAHHFADTCILALAGERAVGFVSAYRPPGRPDTLFVWQVAVAPEARGQGLAGRMLRALLARPALRGVTRIETTVSPSNAASRGMFARLAADLAAPLEEGALFDAEYFGAEAHEDERLIAIGPFSTETITKEDT
ncbi:MAG TPA: diaminobutyrate acetyltransferase [Pelomicrobium sp.]|nr:diaminobutyrate acetyltransferase [Pelomicrobium sp.]